ncbi:MAG: cytochrome c biogenesis protein CcsA [Crocinitomicaceae bacterium]
MERFSNFLFSMKMMTLGLVIFLLAIATATFLESIYDIETAKIVIYNALWFEALLVFLSINLIANIFRYRMYVREKIAMLMFHVSFLIIMIGAAVTRFISFEGQMQIPEGTESSVILSADPYMQIEIIDEEKSLRNRIEEKMFMSEVTNNFFHYDAQFPNRDGEILIEYMDFQKNMIDSLVINDSIKGSALEFVIQGQSKFVSEGDIQNLNGLNVSFLSDEVDNGITVTRQGAKLLMKTGVPVKYLDMSQLTVADRQNPTVADSMTVDVGIDTIIPLETGKLYTAGMVQFVFKGLQDHAKQMLMPSGKKNVGVDVVTVKVSDQGKSRIVSMRGGMGQVPVREAFEWNGLKYSFKYGSKPIELPFSVGCKDFQLDRYPGSNSPSSFASELYINDTEKGYRRDQRIFMNHVMDYQGYRFFQSSYFPDESGTILSVNHDWWGTNITYLGYLLMSIAMIMSLFAPVGRFKELNGALKKTREKKSKLGISVLLILLSFGAFAQNDHDHNHDHDHDHVQEQTQPQPQAKVTKPRFTVITKEHSQELETMLVQDFQGRVIPYHTFCNQILRKLSRKNTYQDYNAVQTVTSMHMYFDHWSNEDIIYVSSVLRDKFDGKKMISLVDMMGDNGDFILAPDYEKAHQKLESKRTEYDKKLIKLEERFEVITAVFLWRYMRIIPMKGDPNNTWYVPMNMELMQVDTASSKVAYGYFNALDQAAESDNYKDANVLLENLKTLQRKLGAKVAPSESKVDMEISYNKMNVFKNTWRSYGILGVILLLIFFVRIFMTPTEKKEKFFKSISMVLKLLLVIVFIYHGAGLGMRWYITGHAPWSNGYEAVVFIAWVTMIAGFFFSRKNAAVLAGTTVLAMFMLFVTEMNLLDPEITPLVPVLKSYWLMIHVAIITGSYGFLGLGCILGLLNLLLYSSLTDKNGEKLKLNIAELTYVSEMTITIGLFMLTIGTFLGGIWANESWGRYWGWDPKETWALVSVLVYAVILHLRFVPGLKSKFTFNVASFWGYSSILFTFFGVNFYLTGLHSYAQGDTIGKFPTYVIYLALGFAALTLFAWWRNKVYSKNQRDKLLK